MSMWPNLRIQAAQLVPTRQHVRRDRLCRHRGHTGRPPRRRNSRIARRTPRRRHRPGPVQQAPGFTGFVSNASTSCPKSTPLRRRSIQDVPGGKAHTGLGSNVIRTPGTSNPSPPPGPTQTSACATGKVRPKPQLNASIPCHHQWAKSVFSSLLRFRAAMVRALAYRAPLRPSYSATRNPKAASQKSWGMTDSTRIPVCW